MNFRYFGWKSLSDWQSASSLEAVQNISQLQTWFTHYQGRERHLIPNWVEISYQREYEKKTEQRIRQIPIVNHDPDRLQFYLSGVSDEG